MGNSRRCPNRYYIYGNSPNVIEEVAKEKGMKTIGLLEKAEEKLKDMVDIAIVVPLQKIQTEFRKFISN